MSQPFFRKRKTHAVVLSSQQSARQGSAVRSALAAFPDNAAALMFLNNHHDALRGRPIDLAVASDTGLEAVIATLSGPKTAAARVGGEA